MQGRLFEPEKAHRDDFAWLPVKSTAIAAYWRTFAQDRVLVLHNLSDQVQAIEMEILSQPMIDLLTGTPCTASDQITLNPYQFLWLQSRES